MIYFDSSPSFDGRNLRFVLGIQGSSVDVCGLISFWMKFMSGFMIFRWVSSKLYYLLLWDSLLKEDPAIRTCICMYVLLVATNVQHRVRVWYADNSTIFWRSIVGMYRVRSTQCVLWALPKNGFTYHNMKENYHLRDMSVWAILIL
jgi:hypothetical protein